MIALYWVEYIKINEVQDTLHSIRNVINKHKQKKVEYSTLSEQDIQEQIEMYQEAENYIINKFPEALL